MACVVIAIKISFYKGSLQVRNLSKGQNYSIGVVLGKLLLIEKYAKFKYKISSND